MMALLQVPDKYAQERGGWKSDQVMKVDNMMDGYFKEAMQHELQHKIKTP